MIQYTQKLIDFKDLSNSELYAILALRQEVFIVEQNCPFLDADGKDLDAQHLLIFNENHQLIAYSRLLKTGIAYDDYPSIGRVVSSPKARGTGIGKILMQESIKACGQLFDEVPIKIGAQLYLKAFYESFGFVAVSEPYDEDGILHISMLRS
jgi:ElaA protein